MNPIIFVPFVKHRLSSSVCFNELCHGCTEKWSYTAGLHHLTGKDLLIKHIVTAIEICGMRLFLVPKCLTIIKTFWCLPRDSLVP